MAVDSKDVVVLDLHDDGSAEEGKTKTYAPHELPRGFRFSGSDGNIQYKVPAANGADLHDQDDDDDDGDDEEWEPLCSPIRFVATTRDHNRRAWGLLVRVKTPTGGTNRQSHVN